MDSINYQTTTSGAKDALEFSSRDLGVSSMEFQGEFDDQYKLIAIYYKINKLKNAFFIFLMVITGGLVYLFYRWFLSFKLAIRYSQCNFMEMTHLLINKTKNDIRIAEDQLVEVQQNTRKLPNCNYARMFEYELSQFYIDCQTFQLNYLKNSFSHLTCAQLTVATDLNEWSEVYGRNVMDVPIKSIPLLILDEILTPFNIFQIFALVIWAVDNYVLYAVLIFVLTLFQMIMQLREIRANLFKIRNMILFSTTVKVCQFESIVEKSSIDLSPGDIIIVEGNTKISCDCILIDGACVMNEAILTGESVPVNKTALLKTNNLFRQKENENSMLYCGTFCLRSYSNSNQPVKALVYQTGFQTLKGGLARSILFNVNQSFSFQRDSLKYLFVLAFLGVVQSVISLYLDFSNDATVGEAIINALELLTIIIPPALPTALAAGVSLALNRLEKQKIQCIKPDKVNVAAKVNICAFDKTGTLTELGLDVVGFRPIKGMGFDKKVQISECDEISIEGMATCHSLSLIDNEVQGDPIDLNMFLQTGWKFTEKDITFQDKSLTLIRRFEFQAELQRMSVIVSDHKLFCKGSPEMIQTICQKVPENYKTILNRYASKGYRVIALAYREIPKVLKSEILTGKRELFESQLVFLGFLIFENRLKELTSRTIRELKASNLKPIMVTGDNPLTAINIGQQCYILEQNQKIYLSQIKDQDIIWQEMAMQDQVINEGSSYSIDNIQSKTLTTDDILRSNNNFQLCITGDVFEQLQYQYNQAINKEEILNLFSQIFIYARMKPNHKGDLMILLKQDKKNFIAFCGDGTNDTCALRQADVGLALSTEDASLAAPFTSSIFNISSLITLIREGRACLVTCVECFKFMTLYSCIQSAMVLQCYFWNTDLSLYQYLYQDLWLIIPLAFTMDLTSAFPTLARYRPISDLISIPIISSVAVAALSSIAMQVGLIQYLTSQEEFELDEPDEGAPGQINTMLILLSNSEVLAVAIAFTQGPPFRQQVYKNLAYIVTVTLGILGHIFVIFYPQGFQHLEIVVITSLRFEWIIIGFSLIIGVFIILYEKFVTQALVKKYSQQDVNLSV
ncbi:unnamed protein product (macronuclear) [Paramecium tetraurelia]|uniref:Cation-transporting ATPase n=1 Tax=Paramecium tetraurelia TaxID=5888 RepID=A0DD34_PARTE|nr:uncharacterized protein GSPATT00015810001 [Paramecium tetraurelia]CAK80951.1 unnamed protein product [Paramecium tetraurelia]|eukprot:XP_001448348.1 hypothetical protein (macronuclear) [Paramecium tetraurelia strain d4-2]